MFRWYRANAETGRIEADSPKLDEPRPRIHAAGVAFVGTCEEMKKESRKRGMREE